MIKKFKYRLSNLVAFIIGYFIVGFVLFFNTHSIYHMMLKLIWANLGIVCALLYCWWAYYQDNEPKERKNDKN